MTQPDPAATVPEAELAKPLVDRLVRRAESGGPAFTHIGYPGHDAVEDTLDWPGLLRRVRSVAVRISAVSEPGQLVAVVARQDLNYVVGFLAILYAGRVAVPLSEPSGRAQLARLGGVLADCAPPVWLTSSKLAAKVQALAEQENVPAPRAVIAVDTIEDVPGGSPFDGDLPFDVEMDAPAYLQYTSGSTSSPAGAVITHRALVASCWQVRQAYELDESVSFVGWIPFFHDMGLMLLICQPLFCGARSVFIAPLEFVRRPVRWLRLLADYPSVVTAAPNFAYDLIVELARTERFTFDLSGVWVALNGSEPNRAHTVAGVNEMLGALGFPWSAHRPCYGLAEATVFVATTGRAGPTVTAFDRGALRDGRAIAVGADAPAAELVVSVGRTRGQDVLIVDNETRKVTAEGDVGEIWVRGPNLARGYWGRPDRAGEHFGGRLAEAPDGLIADGWLRTGDLGVWHDGQLYVTGRLKDLIIIDGRNHYPQDIEETAGNAHDAVRRDRVAAFAVPGQAGEEVVVIAEFGGGRSKVDHDVVTTAIRHAVSARHELALRDVRLVRPGGVPRTSSGKVSRTGARDRWRSMVSEMPEATEPEATE